MANSSFPIAGSLATEEDRLESFYDDSFSMESRADNESSSGNSTYPEKLPSLPIDMQFNDGHRLAIAVYSLLMLASAVGNLSVLSTIIKRRVQGRFTRINMFLLHLVIADLLVTFLMMPLEITWNATVSWHAGDKACRILLFFRIFGLYLSGFILMCISLDRYFAVLKPMSIREAKSRSKLMLCVAWIASVLCSLPQPFIFHVEKHPDFPWYEQCVTFNSFPSKEYELAYNFFGFVFLYGAPLIMIVCCYSRILCEIYRINATKKNGEELRRSSMDALGRAKIRTLKMTVMIVATFFFCWTPYNVMSLWYWFDKKSAQDVDQRIQKGLFLFACTNSCVNPLIYGLFHFRKRTKFSTSTMPRSAITGYQRPKAQSLNCNRRSRWQPIECCQAGCGCGSIEMSNDSMPHYSGHQNRDIRVRPVSPGNSTQIIHRYPVTTMHQSAYVSHRINCQRNSRPEIKPWMHHRTNTAHHHSHGIPMTDYEQFYARTGRESSFSTGAHNVIQDRNSKGAFLSSAI